ncbi:hypothetical protein JCM17845_25230 [Iodidimonas gelatinilytica]|uniref:Uncharacterized protein n=1 Tax=Iodidimonas gelatinilytica TaxID=1236966 RepID=A0A5A7N3E3_9PROT|nr:hypothetical protein [Iodidimonas gelatinilytica]GER01900.1 hypothetical protein JCM17845_25230 [Iodidimonas gelatinilytica]
MSQMTQERFEQIVSAYGADMRRWPSAERADAAAFLAQNETLDVVAKARTLDHFLDSETPCAPASPDFLQSLMAIPRQSRSDILHDGRYGGFAAQPAGWQTAFKNRPRMAIYAPSTAFVVAMIMGLWFGASNWVGTPETVDLTPYLMGSDIAFYEDSEE